MPPGRAFSPAGRGHAGWHPRLGRRIIPGHAPGVREGCCRRRWHHCAPGGSRAARPALTGKLAAPSPGSLTGSSCPGAAAAAAGSAGLWRPSRGVVFRRQWRVQRGPRVRGCEGIIGQAGSARTAPPSPARILLAQSDGGTGLQAGLDPRKKLSAGLYPGGGGSGAGSGRGMPCRLVLLPTGSGTIGIRGGGCYGPGKTPGAFFGVGVWR